MNCRDVQIRMVAHLDAELAPSEHHQIAEHIGHCPGCTALGSRLLRVQPVNALVIDPGTLSSLRRQVALHSIESRAHEPPGHPLYASWSHWIRKFTPLPRLTIAAWAVALLGAMTWGSPRAEPPPGQSHHPGL